METEQRPARGAFPLNIACSVVQFMGGFEVVSDGVYETSQQEPDLPDGCFTRPSMEDIFTDVGLESWCMDSVFLSEQQRVLQLRAEIRLVEYPACERRPDVLPLRPKPYGGGTVEAESVTGYILRLADINRIVPDAFAHFVWTGFAEKEIRQFGGCLALLGQGAEEPFRLHPLEAALRLPRRSLYQHTLLPLYRQFFNFQEVEGMEMAGYFLKSFFAKSEFKVCPLCLSDPVPYYRLLWNLYEVTVCIRHSVYLVNRCPKCTKPLRELTERSALGRCAECLTPLKKAKPLMAFEADVMHQRRFLADYSWLLERAAGDERGALRDWPLGLRAVRIDRNLSLDDVAKYLSMHPGVLQDIESGTWRGVSLSDLLSLMRFLCGSVEAFYDVKERIIEGRSDLQRNPDVQ